MHGYATVQHRHRQRAISPSVCHTGIDSKLMTIGSCSFHHQVAQGQQLSYPWSQGNTSCKGFKQDWGE